MPEKVSLSRLIIKVSGLLSFFTSAVILAVVVYSLMTLGPGRELQKLTGTDILVSRGLMLAVVVLIFGFLELKTASGMVSKKRWSWISAILIGIVLSLLVPLGTIFGLKLLVNLFSSEVKDWFGWQPSGAVGQVAKPAETPPGVDLELLQQQEKEQDREDKENF
jgi:hypothetical protein